MSWQELKSLVQSTTPEAFEELTAALLTSFLNIPFMVARSGDQPSGDARDLEGKVSMQAKRYTGKRSPNAKTVEGDIRQVNRKLQHLQVYILAVSRDTAQLRDTLDAVEEETGLDIVILELSDKLSDIGVLCVTFWENIRGFFNSSDIYQDPNFLAWVEDRKNDPKTNEKIEDIRLKLEEGIQTRHQVYKDTRKYLHKRFGYDTDHTLRFKYPIDLSKAIDRESLESQITNWWDTPGKPICYLEGEEGMGKSWLAAKWVKSICEDKKIVTFWLDSDMWKGCESLDDLFETCLKTIPGYHNEKKCTAIGFLDHPLKEDCATIQSH